MIFCFLPSFFAFCSVQLMLMYYFCVLRLSIMLPVVLFFFSFTNFSLENLNHHVYVFYRSFASGLLAWILSRILGASVGFRVGGWKCLRDVVVKFKKVCLCLHSLPYFIFGILKGIGGLGGGAGYSSTE